MTKPRKTQPRKHPRSPRGLQLPNAICFTVEGFQALGGPGRTKIYELGKAGVLKIYKDILGRTLIDGNSGREYLSKGSPISRSMRNQDEATA